MVAKQRSQISNSAEELTAESSFKLKRLCARHQEEAARLRDQFGDPEASLSAFVRKTYDQDPITDDRIAPRL